jgi:putative PIN family toxin of toxin-antitoxin system
VSEAAPIVVVFDCNVFLQAFLSDRGPAYGCLRMALDGHVRLAVSPVVLEEIRELPLRPKLQRFSAMSVERVERVLAQILPILTIIRDVPEVFQYARDPDDAHYVNLALAAGATTIISRDKDLLDLMDPSRPEAQDFRRQFPQLLIVTPEMFLKAWQNPGFPGGEPEP